MQPPASSAAPTTDPAPSSAHAAYVGPSAYLPTPRWAQPANEPSPDRARRRTGGVLFALALLGGIALNVAFFALELFGSAQKHGFEAASGAMLAGAVPAFVMLLFYVPIPMVLDRFDPEPWWSLLGAFLWGALVATGVAGFVNSFVHVAVDRALGADLARLVTTTVSAPISEEVMKGMLVWGVFYFLRREFDGTVDGIVYATFCALGFAAVENVTYYARAAMAGDDVFAQTFFLRGIVAPWGHPLYTSMTGLGMGIARETESAWIRFFAPILGLLGAIALHAIWNFVPNLGGDVFVVSLLFWFAFVGLFTVIVIGLVVRKGRVIRAHLEDEIPFGTISRDEFKLVTSPLGGLRTYFVPKGSAWRRLIRSCSRLALSKWHTARAMRGQKRTFSIEFIAPLRAEIRAIRAELNATR
jgi:RsiW-degrading membrane proteinase PrsW (M82 family)